MKQLFLTVLLMAQFDLRAQPKKGLYEGQWRAQVYRQDSIPIVFNFETKKVNNQWQLIIRNAREQIEINKIIIEGDSVQFAMPVFESEFKAAIQSNGSLKGNWYKGTALQTQEWVFIAEPNKKARFEPINGNATFNISGRWAVSITRPNGTIRPAIGEFFQKGNQLTGTFLNPSGDYRYLEGIVTGNQLLLSVFDGSHSYLFSATVNSKNEISDGIFYSGAMGKEAWIATKDATAQLPDVGNAPQLKEGSERIQFSYKDLNRAIVSSTDERFKNKVVIVQIMGSWCPNCMDETKFLSEYYTKNKDRGIEIVALAYENSTDYERSRNSLLKFKERFNVQYPMLITGVWVNDSLRTEKTLPQLTPIKAFPTTILIGKDGKVKKIRSGFLGPGTGKLHEAYKKEFYKEIDALRKE